VGSERSRRSAPRRIASLGALAIVVSVAGLAGGGTVMGARPAAATVVNGYEVPTIADTAYPIPAGALFVAPNGRDTNAGTQAAPFLTLTHVVAVAPSGATIVLRAGTYRERVPNIYRKVTLQPYPHERVWLNGSVVVSGFGYHPSNGFWSHAWTSSLCHTCYPAAAIDPNYPAAGLPDQVFFDGTPLQQVSAPTALRAGKFYVDLTSHLLWVGSNPGGHVVESTGYDRAIEIDTAGAAGSAVRGLGFRDYGPHYNMDLPAMVVVTSPNVTLDHDTFAWSAGRGLSVLAAGGSVTDDLFLYNGLNGFHANAADNLDFERNRIAYSNEEHFSIVPSSSAQIGGAKITTTQHAVVRSNLVTDNWCNGLWVDVSSYDAVIADNAVLRNAGQGIGFEISAKGVIAGNVSADNGRDGIKVSGATNVDVWNNTLVRNGWAQLGVYEDPRHNTNPAQVALGITWDTARVTAFNNVLEATSTATHPVLESFDASNPRWTTTTAMLVADDDNLWGRPVATAPTLMASWQRNLTTTSRFATLPALQSGVAREGSGRSADGVPLTTLFVDPAHDDFTLASGSLAAVAGAALPASVAAAIGVPAGLVPPLGALAVP
jgi:hypothetical protein